MQSTCTKCSAVFTITDHDKALYEKLAPEIGGRKIALPTPALCTDCRSVLRMATRNELTLYSRKCDLSGESMVSTFDADAPYPVYSQDSWWSDKWDCLSNGKDYDFQRPFFEQWNGLFLSAPKIALYNANSENSDFCNNSEDNKNCYLCMGIAFCEDCLYTRRCLHNTGAVDCYDIHKSQYLYESTNVLESYTVQWSQTLRNCSDLLFCMDCIGCTNCIGCINLRQKEYCVFNEEVGKEKYEELLHSVQGKYSKLMELQKQSEQFFATQFVRASQNVNCENCEGDFLSSCKDCSNCYYLKEAEECAHSSFGFQLETSIDTDFADATTLACNSTALERSYGTLYSFLMVHSHNCIYSHLLVRCKDCFGCCSLKDKQYCIFNKQYTKEEYEELVPKIISHMESTGEWGQFYPPELSPFAYNETVANEFYPSDEKSVLAQGWRWKKEEHEDLNVTKTIQAAQLPDSIEDIPDDILNWAIVCAQSKKPFRISKQELDFYKTQKLPVPRLHPDERHKVRVRKRNPNRITVKQCGKCGKEVQTTYEKRSDVKVYCEQCYLEEVY